VRFELHEDDALVAESVEAFANRVAGKAPAWDAEGVLPQAVVDEVAALGLFALQLPEGQGGAGLSLAASVAVIEALAGASPALALVVAVHNLSAIAWVVAAGSDRQREEWLPALARAEILGTGACLPSAAWHGGAQAQGWSLVGEVPYVIGARLADRVVVHDPAGGAAVVDMMTPGVSMEAAETMGLGAAGLGHVSLGTVGVPASRALPGADPAVARQVADALAVGVAAVALGIGRASLSCAVAYAKERQQFGRPIASFQAIQWKLADMATALEAARLATYAAAVGLDRGGPGPPPAQAKLRAGEAAVRLASEALQIHGGYGYTQEFPVERQLRDAITCRLVAGVPEDDRARAAAAIRQRFA
jgi:alkylation response protein AidB-like acyl-CoA dehydrogenase